MVISHGDTLIIDDPRLSVTFEEDTGKSVLTVGVPFLKGFET